MDSEEGANWYPRLQPQAPFPVLYYNAIYVVEMSSPMKGKVKGIVDHTHASEVEKISAVCHSTKWNPHFP